MAGVFPVAIHGSWENKMSEIETAWSYYTWHAKVPSINSLNEGFTLLGEQGWELVTSVSTVKTWMNMTGNDLIFVFKKPGKGQVVKRDIGQSDGTW